MAYVDFKLIHPSILANIIEPLDIVPNDMLIEAFRFQAQLPAGSGPKRNRGTIAAKPENLRFQWSQIAHGKQCVIMENDALINQIREDTNGPERRYQFAVMKFMNGIFILKKLASIFGSESVPKENLK